MKLSFVTETISLEIVQKTTKFPFRGNVEINFGLTTLVSYNLINQKDQSDFKKGEFEGNYRNLAPIISKLDSIINTI